MRAGFWVAGLGAGLASGWYAHERTSSWVFALFVLVMVSDVIGRWIGGIITDRTHPSKGRRIFLRGLPPAIAIGALAGSYWLWQRWWLAAIIGFAGYLCGFVIGSASSSVPSSEGVRPEGARNTASRQLPEHVKEGLGTPTGGAFIVNYDTLRLLERRALRAAARSTQPPRKRGKRK